MHTHDLRTIKARTISAAAVAAWLAAAPAAAQAPPAEAFAALPAMQSPALSPDGSTLAFIAHGPAGSYILVSKLDEMSVTHGIDTAESKARSVFWAGDDALVFTAGVTTSFVLVPGRLESTSPYGVDLSGPAAEVMQLLRTRRTRQTRRGGGGATQIGGFFAVDGAQLVGYERSSGRVLFPKFDTLEGERVLYAVDPKTDQRRVVDRGTRFTFDWVVDEAGEPVFRIDYTDKSDQFRLMGRRDGRWETVVAETVEVPELSMYGLDADGRLVVGLRPEDRDKFGLYTLSAETGELGEPVLTSDEHDVGGVRIDPYTNRVVGAAVAGEGPVWFDDELARHQVLLDEAFPGESPTIASWSEDRERMIIITEGSDRAPAVYLYEPERSSVAQIGSVYIGFERVELPDRRPYGYTARDGTRIPGYLTRPLGADGATPLVVLPHGGPAARDVGGFDWMAHFFATRGYTVLQPNFRGSGGYGKAWEEAGHGEWGIGVMQHDVSDGVAALVEAGLADPQRVCIVGASYGGYAALAGAVFTPELYRCAAAIAPVADLVDMLSFERDRSGGRSAAVSYWREAMSGGDPDGLDERLRAASPAAHAEHAEAPILLVHGRDDSVVPIAQSRGMERALRSAGKRVELVELDGEDHWLSVPETRLATLQALEGFLAEHLGD